MPIESLNQEMFSDELKSEEIHTALASLIKRFFKDESGPHLIAIGGAGGTGKSTFSHLLKSQLQEACVLHLDDYKTCRKVRKSKGIFGPHPQANEMDLIFEHLAMLKSDLCIDHPVYNSQLGFADSTIMFSPKQFVIVEGEIATYQDFAQLIDFHIFIDADVHTQLQTRLTRDVVDRGYSLHKAIATFVGSNMGEFLEYGADSKEWADIKLHCDRNYSLFFSGISSKLNHFFI